VPDALLGVLACALSAGCGALVSLRLGVALACALAAGLAVAGAEIVPLLLVTLVPWAAGRLLRSRRELVQALEERNLALEAEQAALAELAVRQERARIARELHDIVAHHLAVIVIQAGAGRLDASNGELRFEGIGAAGREALGELDRLVELLQAENPGDLGALVGQARAAGMPLEYSPAEVPEALRDVAYRVVQEALTNAMKHAAGSAVSVRLAIGDGALEVEVRDEGAAASALASSGAGIGLAGMRERVEAVGGRLEAGPWNRGWRVLARLPTPAG
jgi:signal transduction histidine kinase